MTPTGRPSVRRCLTVASAQTRRPLRRPSTTSSRSSFTNKSSRLCGAGSPEPIWRCSVQLIRQVYRYYLVGDIRYTRKRFLAIGFGLVVAAFNILLQGTNSYLRSKLIEDFGDPASLVERFFIAVSSVWLCCWVLLQVLQFALFLALVTVKRFRAAR